MNEFERNGQGNEDSEPVVNFRTLPPSPSIPTENPGTRGRSDIPYRFSSSSPSPPPPALESSESTAPRGSLSTNQNQNLEEELLESSFEKDLSTTAAPQPNKSDLIPPISKLGIRIRKRSEEGRKAHLDSGIGGGSKSKAGPGKNRKQNSIPVGIAVAWQRHVTSTSTSSHTNTSSYTNKHHHPIRSTMSSPPPKPKRLAASPSSTARSTPPVPHSSVPGDTLGRVTKKLVEFEHEQRGLNSSSPQNSSSINNNDDAAHSPFLAKKKNGLSNRDGLRTGDAEFKSDIEGDGDVNVGASAGRARIPASINNNSNSSFFPSAYGFTNPYGDWTSQYLVPNSSQQSK